MSRMRSSSFLHPFLLVVMLLSFFIGCGGTRPFIAPEPIPDDRYTVPQPKYRKSINNLADGFDKQFALQGEQCVDLSRHLRRLAGRPKEAYNVDAFDEVPNSSWFTNRNAHRRMSIEEIVRGPDTGEGPEVSNAWTIIRAKAEGVTPGFTIVDSRGDKYVIKFDPFGYSGSNSGSEVIGTKLFYAAGYNAPENYVTCFHPRILRIGDKVKFTDEKGRTRYMTESDLEAILKRMEYQPDGLIRATASKYISGKILGPFKYSSTRKDDPNDVVPHHHRRELRGLGVMAAWLNHVDTKGANSMDAYVTENGRSYVKHYLMDFGTILGSAGEGPQSKSSGHENQIDPNALLFRILTLGFYVPGWERVPDTVEYPCIGRYDSQFFHPRKFKPNFPNPAFDNMTDRDGYWGAKLVMSFTDEQLRTVVAEAKYPGPEAAEYLLKTLIERRDITGRYWFDRVVPLDHFKLVSTQDGRQALHFMDLAVETGLESMEEANYRYSLRRNGVKVVPATDLGPKTVIPLPDPQAWLTESRPDSYPEDQWEVTVQVKRGDRGEWSRWLKVYLREETTDPYFKLLGLKRQG